MSWPFHILHLMTKFDFMGIQNLPCEQRFLSCMAFNVNQVIHVPYQFCSWPVLHTGCKQTNYVTDKPSGQLCKRYKSCKRKTPAPSEVYKIRLESTADCLILVFTSKKGLNHDLPPLK